jgi:hypothetical protein
LEPIGIAAFPDKYAAKYRPVISGKYEVASYNRLAHCSSNTFTGDNISPYPTSPANLAISNILDNHVTKDELRAELERQAQRYKDGRFQELSATRLLN